MGNQKKELSFSPGRVYAPTATAVRGLLPGQGPYLGQHVPELREYFSLFSQKPELSGWLPGGQLPVLESGVPEQPVLHRAGGSAGVHRVCFGDIGRVQNVSGRVQ